MRVAGHIKTNPSTPRLRRVRDEIDNTKKMLKTEFTIPQLTQVDLRLAQRKSQHNKPGIKTKGKYPIFFTQNTPNPTYSSLITTNFSLSASPFGVVLQEREFSSSAYRYGFNGQERDDEVAGAGNSYTADYWQYDPRIGRRWNLDPIDQFRISNYACFENSPIGLNDLFGDKVAYSGETRKERNSVKRDVLKARINSAQFRRDFRALKNNEIVTFRFQKVQSEKAGVPIGPAAAVNSNITGFALGLVDATGQRIDPRFLPATLGGGINPNVSTDANPFGSNQEIVTINYRIPNSEKGKSITSELAKGNKEIISENSYLSGSITIAGGSNDDTGQDRITIYEGINNSVIASYLMPITTPRDTPDVLWQENTFQFSFPKSTQIRIEISNDSDSKKGPGAYGIKYRIQEN